jgi:hypothetical protein
MKKSFEEEDQLIFRGRRGDLRGHVDEKFC